MIFDRTIPPGSRVDATTLAAQLGASVEHVVHALSRLQITRLVRFASADSVIVEELSSSECEEIYAMRELLEELAARLAAPRLTEDDLRKLEQIERDLVAMAELGEVDRSLALHRDLHFTIYNACGAHHLLSTLDRLWNLSGRFRALQVHASENRIRGALYEIHTMVDACRRRDAEGLGLIVRYKIHQTRVSVSGRPMPDVDPPRRAKSTLR